MKKRVLSLFMALALCLTLLPAPAWAAEADAPEGGAIVQEEQQQEKTLAAESPAISEQAAENGIAAQNGGGSTVENAVAEVTIGDTTAQYATLTEAITAAQKSNGSTVKLLANCETPDTSKQFDISGNYTLDLNSCTLTGRLYLSQTSTSLTVKDSSTGGKIQATAGWSPLWVDGGDVTIESGTLATEKDTVQALVFGQEAACGTLTITGGSFETGYVYIGYDGGKTVISGGAFHELRVNGDYSKRVTLSGGTFDTVMRRKSGSTIAPTDLLADGYTFVNRTTSTEVSTSQEADLTNVKVVSKETVNALVSLTVGGTKTHYYGTFEEALTAAQKTQGGTLTLLNNVTTTPTDINSGTFTLDLNGHTLTSEYNATLVVIGGSLTIQDSKSGGVISSTSSDSKAVWCGGGNVTILGGSFPSALYWESGTVSLQGGAFRSLDSKAGSWLSAIPEGKALERDDDHSVVDASAKTIIAPTGFYVLADHEEHTWENGKCACGREHTDHKWKDGECTVCHLTCSHGTIGGDGVCTTCGTRFTVKANHDYYKHLSDALASENVDDVTLLADDILSTDVRLERDIMFFPNGHTVSGGGSIVVPSGKRLTFHGNENGETGNAGTIRVNDGGTLVVDEGFTGTVQTLTVSEHAKVTLCGGTYGTITGLRQKAGTLLYYNTVSVEKHLAFQKQDGTFARYDQRISSETPLKNVTVVGCPDKGLTEACGETCEYCDGALRCRIGASGYRNMSDAIRDVPDGGTITLLRDYSAVYNISANVDRAYTIDLNGYSVRKNSDGISLAVYAGTPKIIDSKGGGVIAGLEIDSTLGLTLADLLPEGYTFKSGSTWITDLTGKELTNVSMAKIPIKSMDYPTEMSMTYGGTGTLLVNVTKETGTGAVSFQWYKVENGNETAVGSATTKNQFDLSAQKLSAGKHIFRFSATCDGYEKMSEDIVVTVQKADIRSITPPTALENLTYTGQEQALITAGSVTSGGTMQYSLTENGTYSPDIPVGTDAGTYTVWYRVIGDANHNDTAPASVEVSIGKKPLTISGVTAVSKPYDGTTDAGITSVTFDGVTLTRDTDYTVTASFDDASVGNGKNITATVTLMGQAAKNYVLEQSNFMTTGSITKAAAPDFTKATALVIVNGHEKTYTVTLPALPTLETPKEYGAPTYELGEIKLNDGYYTSGARVENGALTLPIQKNDVETTGSVGTVTVVIKSANYEDITLTVNVNATNKLIPTVTAPTANALTYNGSEQALVTAGKTTGGTMLYRLGDSKWSEQIPTAKNAGEYTVWYKVQGNAEYADVAEQNVTVIAAKKAVTVTALDKSAYTGSTAPDLSSPKADKNYKVEGLVGADTLSGTVTLTYAQTPDMSKPGKTAINITGTLSNDNYEITYVPGTLTVSDRPSSGGGGSSSDRDTSSSGTVKTETTKNNDGSVTKTETKKDGTVIETTTGKDGSTTKTETKKDGSSVTETKAADGSTGTVKTDKHGQTTAETTLSSKAIETAKKSGEAVKAPVEVEASRDSNTAPTVKIELPRNSGDTKVEIPVSNVKPGTVAVLVHADGTEEIVKNSLPTEDGIQLTVNGGATVKIVDNSKNFADTRNHWAKDAIDFVSARGLVNGMSATIYAPNASTTRAQLWTILARQNNADLTGGATWFENAQNWAKAKGISDGANPNGTINRAQMVTMLWRAMGQPAAGGNASFADVPADSYYAQAVAWAVENGITAGVGGGRFDPNSTCTRAQIVTFLYRSYQSK